jgi:hypothetical protein
MKVQGTELKLQTTIDVAYSALDSVLKLSEQKTRLRPAICILQITGSSHIDLYILNWSMSNGYACYHLLPLLFRVK